MSGTNGTRPGTPARARSAVALEHALRHGPFDRALRAALERRELSLESLQRRLRADGYSISLAALSYWQRGLRRPERPESLRVVMAVEGILELPRASLVALLGPPRPRGRRAADGGPPEFTDLLGQSAGLSRVLDGVDAAVNLNFQHLGLQGDLFLSENRSWYLERVRHVVTARQDHADRFVAIHVPDLPGQPPPVLRPISGCRLGRVQADPETGYQAAELVFDHVLASGHPHVFEYEYVPAGPATGIDRYQHASRHHVRQIALRTHFDPRALPARCRHVSQRPGTATPRQVTDLPVSASGTANIVVLDSAPGLEGFCWEWD
ncbi:MAG TPA: hypothetical protein VFN97_22770 [Actinospica sp.]|nr:hypothetical protein [Actinospica sp.]